MDFKTHFFQKAGFILLAICVIFVYSCKTHPPNAPLVVIPEFGKVYIQSNIDDAEIWIDNIFTGKLTPDTVEAETGIRELSLRKENYITINQNIEVIKDSVVELMFTMQFTVQRLVLIEDFANVSCIPCVTSNKIIETLTTTTYGHNKLVAIKYPTNFPSPNDPFYLANSGDCNSRMGYYNIFVAPTTIINGTERPISTDSISIKESIDLQLNQMPQFSIDVIDSIAGTNYFITIQVKVLNDSGLDYTDIVLHTVVTETNIEFSNPPGSNGETKFYDVMRKMLPSNAGESLDGINPEEVAIYQRQLIIDSSWETSELHTVAFVQNVNTKQVYQAGSTFN